MATDPALTACIVTYERPEYLRRCLESLRHTAPDLEVVVVDASTRPSADVVADVSPRATYVHAPELAGWMTKSRNRALRHVRADVVSFLDDDVVVGSGWAVSVVSAFEDPTVAAVAGRTRNGQPGEEHYDPPIGRLLSNGVLTEGFASLPDSIVEVDHGIGANMSFRRSVIGRLGGFRDDYPGTAVREDTDVFLRVGRAGGRIVFVPEAVVDHLPAPHVTGSRFDTRYKLYARRNHMVLLARHAGIRSSMLWRYVSYSFRASASPPSLGAKVRRFGVTLIGLAWGGVAMLRRAGWNPTPIERQGAEADDLRQRLSSANQTRSSG